MKEPAWRNKILLARLAVTLMIAFVVTGLIWYGFSEDVRHRKLQNLLDRPGRVMAFRFILQPIMSAIAAIIDATKDIRTGRSPYFWTILVSSEGRGDRLREGLTSTSRVIFLGLCIDTLYQYIEFKAFFPGEAVVIALLLGFVPYLLLRGLFVRGARWWQAHHQMDKTK